MQLLKNLMMKKFKQENSLKVGGISYDVDLPHIFKLKIFGRLVLSNQGRDYFMDNSILKKRLNTFKSAKGIIRKVSDEVVIDILRAWENWPGTSVDLYRELGLSKMQMAIMIKKAKRLIKSGVVVESEFKEVKLDSLMGAASSMVGPIEISWDKGKVIRFSQVDQLVDFLKKVA